MQSKKVLLVATLFGIGLLAAPLLAVGQPRDTIHIVGSSTVYPFATVVAERFGRSKRFKTPTVEATGSGGGLKLFCEGGGVDTPSVANSSRRIKRSEYDRCQEKGVREIIEIKIGYDGIVLANALRAPPITISRREIYLALAKTIPDPQGKKAFVSNPHRTWKQIRTSLPAYPIRVLGPPPTSGTRDAFLELAMEGGCKSFDWVKALEKTNKSEYKQRCHTIREDGAYVEAGENDNLLVSKLVADPKAFGIFGFSFLLENADKVQGATIEGQIPDFDSIVTGDYSISRSLYFYVKKAHIGKIPGIQQYMRAFLHKRAIGEMGYLTERGLLPLNKDELKKTRYAVAKLQPMERP